MAQIESIFLFSLYIYSLMTLINVVSFIFKLLQEIKGKLAKRKRQYAKSSAVCLHSVSEVVKMVTKADIPPHKKLLDLEPSFAEDENCEQVLTIRYLL